MKVIHRSAHCASLQTPVLTPSTNQRLDIKMDHIRASVDEKYFGYYLNDETSFFPLFSFFSIKNTAAVILFNFSTAQIYYAPLETSIAKKYYFLNYIIWAQTLKWEISKVIETDIKSISDIFNWTGVYIPFLPIDKKSSSRSLLTYFSLSHFNWQLIQWITISVFGVFFFICRKNDFYQRNKRALFIAELQPP